MPPPALYLTADGSHSLRFTDAEGATISYHSRHGAIQESRHIFIHHGLLPRLASAPACLSVYELGFGTGLNALLTRLAARQHPRTRISYRTYETQPIPLQLARQLNYTHILGADAGAMLELHEGAWGEEMELEGNFGFTKVGGWGEGEGEADLIYYDAFAPEDQGELWTEEALGLAYARLRPGGWLLTYCAKGQFKRNLRAVGFRVEGLPGPPGKREITRASRPL